MLDSFNELIIKLQDNFDEFQQHLKDREIKITKQDLVSVTVNGTQEIVDIDIKLNNLEKKEDLENALKLAVNEAMMKVRGVVKDELGALIGDYDLDQFEGFF